MPPSDRDINLANWNAWANVHGQDSYYDSASLIAGRDSLTDLEWAGVTDAVGDVAGRDILHVQCHLAFDGIGLPGFQFIQDEIEYDTRTHHSNQDVFDRIQADDMKQAATIMATFVYQTAMRDEKLPRKPAPGER